MLDNMKPNAGTKCPISLVSSLQLTIVFRVIKLTIIRNSKNIKVPGIMCRRHLLHQRPQQCYLALTEILYI